MNHQIFDLSRWTQEYPLSKLREDARIFVLNRQKQLPNEYNSMDAVEEHVKLMNPAGKILVCPKSLAINIQLREEAFRLKEYLGRRIKTDVFVWAKGEPSNPLVTKVGGIPYWPKAKPWPSNSAKKAIRFIGQISFSDSKDIFNYLPGDVLSIFGDQDALYENESLKFYWLPANLTDLISDIPSEIAKNELLTPFYGIIHRYEDWPDSIEYLGDKYRYPQNISIAQGTKIGGIPSWIQEGESSEGVFLASLGTISVDTSQQWPYENVKEPLGWDHGENCLEIGDMGSLYLFLNKKNEIKAISQCY